MPIKSRQDLLKAIERLPDMVVLQGRSYKKNWLNWLAKYEDVSRSIPDREAKFIYNALNLPEWIIWLAAESGIAHQVIDRACAVGRGPLEFRQSQAAAVRDILPWELVAEYLENPKGRTAYDDIAPDLDAIYRSDSNNTTKQTLIEARLGQGQFRANVAKRWNGQCAVTGCSIVALLRASHIKPWANSSNRDRLNPANGILLAAHADALFDCGLISFADDGVMLVSAQIADDLKQFNLPDRLRREPTEAEKRFLAYHRRHVFAA
jgi:hypothetical protein